MKFTLKVIKIFTFLDLNEFNEAPKILFGHSDPIHFLKINSSLSLIASADTFGKIKLHQFPNIFEMESVLLYKNE